jgi:chromatin segregation and condensation protein Rec8/ScpA/Scc1 (kleisin family)
LAAVAAPVQPLIARRVLSLREAIERVLGRLAATTGPVRFAELATPGGDRLEMMTAFLAVLTLIRRRIVVADQPELFGEITVRAVAVAPVPETVDEPAGFAADD